MKFIQNSEVLFVFITQCIDKIIPIPAENMNALNTEESM